jgi:outer membrane protein TolC
MRWRGPIAGILLLAAALAGCEKQVFRADASFDPYCHLGLPDLEKPTCIPPAAAETPSPTSVLDLERKVHPLTLSEAIATALEQGTVGHDSFGGPGLINERPVVAPGGQAVSDSIRVLALAPAVVGADVEAELARFDARWITSLTWNTIDRPIATESEQVQTGGLPITSINNQDATFQTALLKPLPTGGVAGITFRTDYELSNLPNPVNPFYRPIVQFQFEQPLLQGFGIEINELRAMHPGSLLTPFEQDRRGDGILITRLRVDQQRAEFERNVHQLLYNVEVAYWNLYAAYWGFYSREQGMRLAYQTWRINKSLAESGRLPGAALDQSRGQYEIFRERRLAALGQVLESERQLRGLMGLPAEDGCRLMPIDVPVVAPFRPDWCSAQNEALAARPEIALACAEVKVRELDVERQKNLLLPDLRFLATYDINGLGSHLDGTDGALHSLYADHFNDWTIGLRLNMPLGFRQAHAAVRGAQLTLAASYLALKEQQDRILRQLTRAYRDVLEYQERLRPLRAAREAYGRQLQKDFQEFEAGRDLRVDILLEAQRFWSQALTDEFTMVAQYNSALAQFELAKGTLLHYDNVLISDGPLPPRAQVRATEHEQERGKAIVLRERASPVPHQKGTAEADGLELPILSPGKAPSIPSLFEGLPQAAEMPDDLSAPATGHEPSPGTAPPQVTVIPLDVNGR